jgi:phosphatidylinositol-3-phosphatase
LKRIRIATMTALCVTTLATVSASAAPSRDVAARIARPPVVLIVMENHEYGSIFRSSSAPYLNKNFIPKGTLFTDYHAIGHPSLPNYLAMTSGTTSGCSSDACPRKTYTTNNIFFQLSKEGIGWRAWQESMPSPCDLNYTSLYSVKHNPPLYYADLFPTICKYHDLHYPSKLPTHLQPFTFVTPNICHDMHDCSIATGDRWLHNHVPPLLHAGAIVIITFDEGYSGSGGGGHVLTAMVGPGVARGARNSHRFKHYGLLAGLEDWFGVRRLHAAVTARRLPI